MNHPPNVMLVGLGAIGTIHADRLQKALPDTFSVLIDEDRRMRYEKEGIHLNGNPCFFSFVTPEDDVPPADLFLVAVKQHHLLSAMELMRPFVSEDTTILSLLNGISSEDILADHFPEAQILHGFCVGTDAVRVGGRVGCTNIGRIVFGEKHQIIPSENVVAVSQLFEQADIPNVVPDDILREQWWKFLMNVGINQVSAVSGATYGDFFETPEILSRAVLASREVIAVARHEGINLTEKDIESYVAILRTLTPGGKTSMLQDIEAKRQTEVDLFSGTVMALGRRHGVPTPVNDELHRLICLMQHEYGAD